MKKSPLAATLALSLVLAQPALAETESRLARQALHCSAIFSVFADTLTEDARLAKEFRRGVEIFTEVYARERNGDRAAALREAEQGRSALLKQFREQLEQREPYLREDGVVCGAWADGFFAQGDDWSFVPVYPKVIGMGSRQKYTPIGEQAFKRWKK